VRGRMNKQIAQELGATERTIKAHRQRVMEKMQVKTLPELVSLAERVGGLGGTSEQWTAPDDDGRQGAANAALTTARAK